MGCQGICSKHSIKKPTTRTVGRYESGHKRCSLCEIYLKWDGKRCPCCGTYLRSKPRNSKARSKLIEQKKTQPTKSVSFSNVVNENLQKNLKK